MAMNFSALDLKDFPQKILTFFQSFNSQHVDTNDEDICWLLNLLENWLQIVFILKRKFRYFLLFNLNATFRKIDLRFYFE